MRRILLVLMSTVAAVVAMFGYRTSTPHPTGTTTAVAAGTGTGSGSTGSSTGTATPAPAGGAATASYTGATAQTRWGPVQVRITVSGGKLTAVDVVQVPSGNGRDVEINDYAVPVLTQEALTAQSAKIDSVSGATVTSDGYTSSLQSALDQAGL